MPNGYPAFPVDAVLVERGRVLYATTFNCASCHAADLRGSARGPQLRYTPFIQNDKGNGMILGLKVREERAHGGAFDRMTDAEAEGLSHYLKSVATFRNQGSAEIAIPAVFELGDAAKGRTVFTARCASCHAVTPGAESSGANLSGIGTRITVPRTLQQTWLSPSTTKPTTAAVTMNDGSVVQGRATAMTEFTITLEVNGASRVIDQKDTRKIDMTYPLAGHAALLNRITDDDIHNVTGYLATLK